MNKLFALKEFIEIIPDFNLILFEPLVLVFTIGIFT